MRFYENNFYDAEFQKDIKSGKVDCIIIKDLSRFGRNYIETGEYLEKIFPFLGIRFIAINDSYDSVDPSAADSLSRHLKNLVNDVYARDISRKTGPVLRGKQKRLLRFQCKTELTREMAVKLIDKITVYNDASFHIDFRFQDEYQRLQNRLTSQTEVAHE